MFALGAFDVSLDVEWMNVALSIRYIVRDCNDVVILSERSHCARPTVTIVV